MRALTALLNAAMFDEARHPAWRVLIYDVRSSGDTIGMIVRGALLQTLTGPRDFTADVESLTIEEVAGDFNGDGIAAATLSLAISDPNGEFDPLLTLVAPSSDGRWLRDGNVIRVLEGDARVPQDDWVTTFTGQLVGQAGVVRGRVRRESRIGMDAVDRVPRFLRFHVTSDVFGAGISYQAVAQDVAELDMALDPDEIVFTGWGAQLTAHASTQFVEESPLVAIAQLMLADGFMPRFRGDGKLSQTSGSITKTPSRFYADLDLFLDIERPKHNATPKNRVIVKGLAADLTKIVQPRQKLAEVQITTGFFAQNEEIEVTWSEDRTKLAQNTSMDVLRSVNGGLLAFSGGEVYTETPQSPEGSLAGVITVETGFAPYVVIFLTGVYVALEAIPEEVIVAAFGAGGGFTVPIKSVASAAALSAALLLMAQIGRGHYLIAGEPFEYVFQELVGIAQGSLTGQDLTDDEANELEIQNHLLTTQVQVDTVAERALFREVAKANVRTVQMLCDLALEADDIFELPDQRRFMIRSQSRTLRREAGAVIATLQCFETTPGILP